MGAQIVAMNKSPLFCTIGKGFQIIQNPPSANIVIFDAFGFWRFKITHSFEKCVGNVAWVVVSYVLLAQPTVSRASLLESGFSALRRKCNELKITIRPSRKGSRK
jgi:hypothetical protein